MRLCTVTVVIISINTSGTKVSPPTKPWFCNWKAKSAETAAATIPRGAIQLKNSFSRQFKRVPIAAIKILNGRATNIKMANTTANPQPKSAIAENSIRAAKIINNAEINSTLRDSLNSKMLSTSTCFILAIQIPMMVTVNRPDSCAISLDSAYTPNINDKVPALCKYCGIQCLRSTWPFK